MLFVSSSVLCNCSHSELSAIRRSTEAIKMIIDEYKQWLIDQAPYLMSETRLLMYMCKRETDVEENNGTDESEETANHFGYAGP